MYTEKCLVGTRSLLCQQLQPSLVYQTLLDCKFTIHIICNTHHYKTSVMAVLGCNGLRCVINIILSLFLSTHHWMSYSNTFVALFMCYTQSVLTLPVIIIFIALQTKCPIPDDSQLCQVFISFYVMFKQMGFMCIVL